MSFFHFCLFEPRLCAEELHDRVSVLKVGRWTKTLHLPGYWKRMAKLNWEPANVKPGPKPVVATTLTPYTFSTAASTNTTVTWDLTKPPHRLHEHIRFTSEAIERIKPEATRDGQTVSTWVRELVERELAERRRKRHAA